MMPNQQQPMMMQQGMMQGGMMQQGMMQQGMMQGGMMQGGMMQGGMMQGGMMQPQPKFQQFARGQGIDNNEYNAIISGCTNAFMMKANPLSNACVKNIKNMIRGEWFVFVCPVGSKQYDFSLSIVTGADFLSFSLDSTQFQVCRISN